MQKNFKCCLLAVMFLATTVASAQVTIGSGKVPEDFSVLELVNNELQGLRLPQMTTAQRNKLETETQAFIDEKTGEAMGLQIFNTTTKCVETWNGSVWISSCAPVLCAGFHANLLLCQMSSSNQLTVADLNREAGEAVWYDSETGDTPLGTDEPLVSDNTYYADCSDRSGRWSVTVSIADCSSKPAAGAVTAFTNVMYDFQTQKLEAFATASGGDAVSFKWQVSATSASTDFVDIAGATNAAFYTIPENYISDFVTTETSKELWFRCERTNPMGTTVTSALGMLFIRTNTSGYGEQDGVKYLEIQSLNRHHSGDGKKVKIALTNLGVTNDNNLGNFYQWGRVADGHEVVGWTKQTGTIRDNIFDAATDANRYPGGTAQITGNTTSPALTLTSSGQVASGTNGFGQFIPAGTATNYDWSNNVTRNNRWGNNGNPANRSTSDILFSSWTFNGISKTANVDGANNNPCPAGWTVPSRWQWKDIHDGDGSSEEYPDDVLKWQPTNGAINNWGTLRPAQDGSFGGAVITNLSGEKVFLPAAGWRNSNDGALSNGGLGGYYWSSTYSNKGTDLTFNLGFGSSSVLAGYNYNKRSYGFSVRCIAEF